MTSFFRRRHRSVDPDDSPPPPALPAPPMPSKSPRWLLGGLISGAGKLISAVFRSDSEESSQRSSIYSDDSSDQDDDDDMIDKGGNDFNQNPDKQLAVRDYNEGSYAIVSKNDSKSVIEQLLLHESFSREECDRLTTLINSRVVDLTCTEGNNDGMQRVNSLAGGFTGSPQVKGQWKYLPGSSSPICDFGTFSLVSPLHSCSSEYRDKAVTEAKKYLEERNKQSHLKNATDLGPCRLNTDMLHCGLKEEMGSPVDLAKSYMQSLPPWQSPAWSNTYFKTPSPFSERLHNMTETHNGTLSLFQTHKRRYPITGSHDSQEKSGSIRQRTMKDLSNGRGEIGIDQSIGKHMITSHDVIHKSNGIGKEMKDTYRSPLLAPDSLLHFAGRNGFTLADCSPSLENNQVPLQAEEQGGSIRSHDDLFVPASSSLNHGGNHSSEAGFVSLQQDKSTVQSDHVAAAVVHFSSMQFQDQREQRFSEANNSFHLNKENSAEKNLFPQESSRIASNDSTNRSSAKGSSEKSEEKSHSHTSTGKAEADSSSTSRSSARKDEKSREIAPAGHVVSSFTDEPVNGMTTKSMECMLTETKEKARGRGRKQVVRSNRRRGRLR